MNKNIISIVLILCLAMALPERAFAASGVEYRIVENSVEVIPVYGYMGPDDYIIAPEPEDNSELEIYVEIPVQIMFAALETDDGNVTSPMFKITNLSDKNDIKAEIESFTQREYPNIDLEDNLSLKLLGENGEELIPDLFPYNLGESVLLVENLPKYAEGYSDNILKFRIGGIWNGSFQNDLKPAFDMTIKFSATEN